MGYYINAWIENGSPQLQIIDAYSKSVCLSWGYTTANNVNTYDKKEIQRLFKELLLLTCKQQMTNYRVFELKPPSTESSQINDDDFICA